MDGNWTRMSLVIRLCFYSEAEIERKKDPTSYTDEDDLSLLLCSTLSDFPSYRI